MKYLQLIPILAILAACGNDDLPNQNPAVSPTSNRNVITHNQILDSVRAMNDAQIAVANAASPRLTDPQTTAYAKAEVSDHSASTNAVNQVSAETHRPLQLSRIALAFQTDGATQAQSILTQAAGTVDASYAQSQVTAHRQQLVIIKCVLRDRVGNNRIGNFLRDSVEPETTRHWNDALALQAALVPDATANTADIDCSNFCQTEELTVELRRASCEQ